MDKQRLSVILVVRNESSNIRRCLDSVKWADEMVVVDQDSQDNTAAICREYTDKVFTVPSKGFCEPDRITAAEHAACEWVLYLDADEEVPPELRAEIRGILDSGVRQNSFYVARRNIFLGEWVKGAGWYPAYVLRLFRKGSVVFPAEIHAAILPLGGYGYLKNQIIHHTCSDLEEYLAKVNRYSGILAWQAWQKGERLNALTLPAKVLFLPLAQASKRFVLQKGFIDGYPGLVIAFLTGLTIFLKEIKLWEIQRKAQALAR
ncbi:MAG: glycosyltransferase family 2 protein [Candidatus Omnitrophica bacterium]|nr:glycosyltransferase family 2 protein [Candidatus Omnitrophota bacterium]MDD5080261.1 glycosyltransferase family 2 protein [Candidatus Omnitrophota bacterium]